MSGRDRFFLRQDNNIITLCEFIIMYDYVGQEQSQKERYFLFTLCKEAETQLRLVVLLTAYMYTN